MIPTDAALAAAISHPAAGLGGRLTLVALLLAVSSAAWWIARRRAERFRPVPARTSDSTSIPGLVALRGRSPDRGTTLTETDLNAALGTRATFVQFSAQTCASCPQVRRVLSDLAATEPGVAHVDLPSEERMDLVRRFSVFRTPTVLLLDADGTVRSRTSGPLSADRALAALAALTLPVTRSTHV